MLTRHLSAHELLGQMDIALRCGQTAVPHERLERDRIHPAHDSSGSVGVAQGVKNKMVLPVLETIIPSKLLHQVAKELSQPSYADRLGYFPKDMAAIPEMFTAPAQHAHANCIGKHCAAFPALSVQPNGVAFQVHKFPFQPADLGDPRPGVQTEQDCVRISAGLVRSVLPGCFEQNFFLINGEHAPAGVAWLGQAQEFARIIARKERDLRIVLVQSDQAGLVEELAADDHAIFYRSRRKGAASMLLGLHVGQKRGNERRRNVDHAVFAQVGDDVLANAGCVRSGAAQILGRPFQECLTGLTNGDVALSGDESIRRVLFGVSSPQLGQAERASKLVDALQDLRAQGGRLECGVAFAGPADTLLDLATPPVRNDAVTDGKIAVRLAVVGAVFVLAKTDSLVAGRRPARFFCSHSVPRLSLVTHGATGRNVNMN